MTSKIADKLLEYAIVVAILICNLWKIRVLLTQRISKI